MYWSSAERNLNLKRNLQEDYQLDHSFTSLDLTQFTKKRERFCQVILFKNLNKIKAIQSLNLPRDKSKVHRFEEQPHLKLLCLN